MLYRVSKVLLGITLTAAIGLGQSQSAETPKPAGSTKQWKDGQVEYNMFAAAQKEADNNKKLQLLDAWKQKYSNTDFKLERLQLYLLTYQALGKLDKMVETAKEMLAIDPKNVQAQYWIAFLSPSLNNTSPEALDMAEKAAKGLLSAEKPEGTSDEAWQRAKKDLETLAHKTLGWVAWQRKSYDAAEQELAQSLKMNPNAGEVSYWLGNVILAQKKPERQSEALYHFARAAALEPSQGGLPQGRAEVDKYLTNAYTKFHGQDAAGLNQLKAMAKASPFPPPDFKIKSAAEIAVEKENEFQKSNPQLAVWMNVKKELTAPNGEQYFQSGMKGTQFPKLKGRLISHKPLARPTTLVLGIENPTTPEVTLKLDAALPGKDEPGADIEFEGVPESFTKEPFMVTFEVEKSKVSGWPAQAAPVKKAAGKKTGPRKKR